MTEQTKVWLADAGLILATVMVVGTVLMLAFRF
jgi:hypothetical protein